MNRIATFVAGLSLAFVGTSTTFAATINVPGDYALIQDAIDASINGDVINIAAGTYIEANLNPGGKAITIQGTVNGDGSLATTIDAQQGGSVFVFDSGETSGTVIKALVITGGTGTNELQLIGGGGIYCYQSSPTITDCTISGNIASYGGGLWCHQSNPTITDCTIEGNLAEYAGGLYCYKSSPTITDCTISGNIADYGGGGDQLGGGFVLDTESNPIISGGTISGNSASYGGGLYCIGNSNPTITDCTITGNTLNNTGTKYTGGGIYCDGSNVTLDNVMVIANSVPEISLINGSTLIQGNSQQGLIGQMQDQIEQQQTAIEDLQQVVTACCAAQSCAGDENNDGVVNIEDLLIIIDAWGPCL